ncbi:hypothetical protein [Clostridium sp.]|nr:hypothetical protein [Clostridium sp.]MBK5240250.1 hypothetical protein [Clostridium sp.]
MDIDLTTYAKEMFGNELVESAYISDVYNKHTDDDYKEIINFSDKEINITDSVILVVKFINGKTVNIWASEWGGMRSGEDSIYIND